MKARAHGRHHLLGDPPLDLLALAVLGVEASGGGLGDIGIAGEQQVQRGGGVLEPSGRVQARSELEADLIGADVARQSEQPV